MLFRSLSQMGVMDAAFTHPHNPVGERDRERIAQWIEFYRANYKAGT